MQKILMVLVVVSMLATLGVLFAGMLGMGRGEGVDGGQGNAERSNRLMRLRVILQGVTIGLFLLLLLARGG